MSAQTLTPNDHAEEVVLFRSQIIGPLTRQLLQHGELAGELEALSHKLFCPPGVDRSRTFSGAPNTPMGHHPCAGVLTKSSAQRGLYVRF